MTDIADIHAREILDSRGNPTVEVEVTLDSGAIGPRGGAVGRLDRGARGGREARRRAKRYGGRGVREAVGACQRRDFRCAIGLRRGRPAPDRPHADRTRRHAEQGPARRQRGARGQPRLREGVGDRARPAALPLCRRRLRAHPAGADDEHRQWRRARRQPDRHPGIHDHAGRRAERAPTRSASASEIFHALRRKLHDAGHNTNVGDEGGFAPNLASADAALSLCHAGDRERRLPPRRGCRAGARPGLDRVLPRRQLPSGRRGQGARCRRAGRLLRPISSPATRSCRSRTAWPRTIGRAGRC